MLPFLPDQFHGNVSMLTSWASEFYCSEPPWLDVFLGERENHGLNSVRTQQLRDMKGVAEFRSSPWLTFLTNASTLYSFSPEVMSAVVATFMDRAPVNLAGYRVQDYTRFIPLSFIRAMHVMPFHLVPGTPFLQVGVLEPAVIPYVEEWVTWVYSRRLSGHPISDLKPALLQYFLVDPRIFDIWLSSLSRLE